MTPSFNRIIRGAAAVSLLLGMPWGCNGSAKIASDPEHCLLPDLSKMHFVAELPSPQEIYDLVVRNLLASRIACPECVPDEKYLGSQFLADDVRAELQRTLKRNKDLMVRTKAYLLGPGDSIPMRIIPIPPDSLGTGTGYVFYAIEITTAFPYRMCKPVAVGEKSFCEPLQDALLYDSRFTVGIPAGYYKDSSSVYHLPPLFLGEDFADYKSSQQFLWSRLKAAAGSPGKADSSLLRQYVFISAYADYMPVNLRAEKKQDGSLYILFHSYLLDADVKATVNEGVISYEIVESRKYLEWFVGLCFSSRIKPGSLPKVTLTETRKGISYFDIEVPGDQEKYKATYSKGKVIFSPY